MLCKKLLLSWLISFIIAEFIILILISKKIISFPLFNDIMNKIFKDKLFLFFGIIFDFIFLSLILFITYALLKKFNLKNNILNFILIFMLVLLIVIIVYFYFFCKIFNRKKTNSLIEILANKLCKFNKVNIMSISKLYIIYFVLLLGLYFTLLSFF